MVSKTGPPRQARYMEIVAGGVMVMSLKMRKYSNIKIMIEHIYSRLFCSLVLCLMMIPAELDANGISSENRVGFEVILLKKGVSRITLPPQPSGQLVCLSNFLDSAAFLIGDSVKVQSPSGDVVLAKIVEENGKKHGVVNGIGGYVDGWLLPIDAERQVLDIFRNVDVTTEVTRSGQYGYVDDIKSDVYPVSYSGVSVEDLQISKKTANSLQSDERIKVPKINFPTMIPKKFEMIYKDGTRRLVMVDPKTRMLLDAKTNKPINADIGDIAGFAETFTNSVKRAERASEQEVAAVAKEVSKAAKDYDTWQAVRKGIVGEVWDPKHPWKSVVTAVAVIGVIQLTSKMWDLLFGILWCLCRGVWCLLLKGMTLVRPMLTRIHRKKISNVMNK